MRKWSVCFVKRRKVLMGAGTLLGVIVSDRLLAQDGAAGLDKANTMIRSYFPYAADILYGVGALVGLIGSIRVYHKFSHSEPDTVRAATNWFGACIFLVIVATVIKLFFGLT